MGLFDFLLRFLLPGRRAPEHHAKGRVRFSQREQQKPRLDPLRRDTRRREVGRSVQPPASEPLEASELPYQFARFSSSYGLYLDLCRDGDASRLEQFGLPVFHTPEQLADWLGLPLPTVAWLVHRFSNGDRPASDREAHYHYHWLRKRTGGFRLIEAPKQVLKSVQSAILREILDRIPLHVGCHGFTAGRSIVTNAQPHVGSAVLVKFDLKNFYATVRFARVVAIFRSLGYCREAAIWLGRLTTSALPVSASYPGGEALAVLPYRHRHLPQGAPSSPALANLSAYGLDIRLSGLGRSFGARYTRYGDDLTFSGPRPFVRSLRVFIPLVTQIIRSERFRVNQKKRKVLRSNQRQLVTGVVVNERPNVSRKDYDRLKAILTNSIRHGPSSQNREQHIDFAAHLRGRVAHVCQLNRARGAKLLGLYQQIDWQL